MNKPIIISVLIVAILAIGGFLYAQNNKAKPTPTTQNQSDQSSNTQDHQKHENQENPTLAQAVDYTNKKEVTINIQDFKFTDQVIKVKKGTKVTWTNQDTVRHNAMKDHEGDDAAHDPGDEQYGTGGFNGPLLAKAESWSYTFTETDINSYHCGPHPQMKGIVQVVE